jgi:outer membrane protein assembly factor BamB
LRTFVIAAIALASVSAPLSAGNWTTSGGNPMRSGLSCEDGPATGLRWEGTLSGWFGTPIFIWHEKLVTMRFQSIDYAPIVCHNLCNGDTLWTRDFEGTNSRSLPVGFNDNRVYAVNFQELPGQGETLYALDPEDGSTIWKSEVLVDMSISESVSYAPDGDLLVNADQFRIARIDQDSGTVVWTTRRVWPVSGSTDIVAYGNRLYAFGGDIGSFYLMAFNIETGAFVDSVTIPDTHPGGHMPQAAPMVGPDGTVYCHKVGDNVTAVRDNGDSLEIIWSTEISGERPYWSPFAHFAVGLDNTVYAASWGRIIRLDPDDGSILDSSRFIQDTSQVIFHVRISAVENVVYVASGGYPPLGGLYGFTRDLELLFYEPVSRLNTCGPAIGAAGVLAVAGDGTTLRVYDPITGIRSPEPARRPQVQAFAWPNPFRASTTIGFTLPAPSVVDLQFYNALGQRVRTHSPAQNQPGGHVVRWDGRDDAGRRLAPGIYVCRITAADQEATVRLTLTD